MVSTALLLTVVLAELLRPYAPRPNSHDGTSPMNVGFTFSERQAGYLDVSWRQAFQAAMDLSPNLVRLGAYWDTIETQPGIYDFSTLDWMLDNVPDGSSVLLTVGMKAPRWPEFYLPAWLQAEIQARGGSVVSDDATLRQATLRYIARVVQHEKGRDNIKYWQVENEPLDPSGAHHWTIDPGFLAQEVGLVRSIDPSRQIVVSMFVDTSPLEYFWPWSRKSQAEAQTLLRIGDVLGLDLYPVRPIVTTHFQLSLSWPLWIWEPRVLALRRQAQRAGRQVWISEAQAEPWLPGLLVDKNSAPPTNTSPSLTASTVDRLQADGFHTILLWGVEYWYMRSERFEDGAWWSHMLAFFHTSGADQSGERLDA